MSNQPQTFERIKAAAKCFWRTCRHRGFFRACSIFWSNFWRSHTHYIDTGVLYGQYSDMRARLGAAMENAFLDFLEGEYRRHHNAMASEDPEGSVYDQVVEHLQWESGIDHEPQAECAGKALRVYRYLKDTRPRMGRIIDELDDRYELEFKTDTDKELNLKCVPEDGGRVFADRSRELRREMEMRTHEARETIAEILPWMWT